jgi:hypothetical protein
MAFSLSIREGPGAGQTLRFDQPEVSFGRVTENDVVLYDPDVSRKHFVITQQGGGYVARDLGSSNGTLVNGARIDAQPLSAGDEIQAGGVVFVFQIAEARGGVPARRPRVRADAGPPAPRTRAAPRGTPAPGAGEHLPARRGAPGAVAPGAASGASARERFRARKEAESPIGRLKLWYGDLPPQRKRIVHIGGGVAALALVLVVVSQAGGDDGITGPRDYSGQVFQYDRQMSQWALGYGAEGITHGARSDFGFAFNYLDGRVTITFDAGFIEGDDEVEIRLNDERLVGYAPLSIGTWVTDVQVVLPANGLRPHSTNTIVFDQIKNPGTRPPATWGIANVRIREEPLAEPDPVRAQERFSLGERRWRDRAIGPRNLYDACRFFREARDYLERLEVKPPLYDEAVARLRECSQELDGIYRRLVFQAQQAEQYRDWQRARGILEQILEYFPDETDPRNQQIRHWLRQYN